MQKRCKLFTKEWTSAGKGGLADILESGWSGTEDWGVWGVGHSHVLNLFMTNLPTEDVVAEVNCAAALVGTRQEQEIDVYASGQHLTTWQFSMQQNPAKRTVRIPISVVTTEEWGFAQVQLEFRPRSVAPLAELDAKLTDVRAVGLALFGIRREA